MHEEVLKSSEADHHSKINIHHKDAKNNKSGLTSFNFDNDLNQSKVEKLYKNQHELWTVPIHP